MAEPDLLFDPSYYASLPAVAQASNAPGPFKAALGSFAHETLGQLGAVVQGAGLGLGMPALVQAGKSFSDQQQAIDARIRPDLQTPPWQAGGAHVVPWLEYQGTKLIPTLAAYALASKFAPGEALPAETRTALGSLPRALGGAGAGAAPEEIAAAGKSLGKFIVGGGVYGGTLGFGSAIQSADQKPGGATVQDAQQALALSPVYAAAGLLTPGFLHGVGGEGGGVISRAVSNALKGSAVASVQSGVMAGLDQSFRPDLTTRQKLGNILDAAVTGAAVGGLAGGVAGSLSSMRHADAHTVSTEDLDQVTNQMLQLPAPASQPDFAQASRNPEGRPLNVTPEGVATPGPDAFTPSSLDQRPAPAAEVRPMQGSTDGELQRQAETAAKYLSSLPADQKADQRTTQISNYLRMANAELVNRGFDPVEVVRAEANAPRTPADIARNVNKSVSGEGVPAEAAGAVERSSDASGGSATSSAAPVPASLKWEDQRSDLLKGIATRKAYADAASIDDLKAKLTARLEAGSTAKSDLTLADRLGVDLNAPAKVDTAQPGPEGQTGTEATLAKPIDTDFQAQLAKELANKKGIALQELRDNPPANKADAQERIFDLLGKNIPGEDEARSFGHDQLIDLAQKYGVLDKDEKYTPAALDIARKGITMEESVQEAQNRGYTGKDASAFDSGARGQPATLDSIDALKIYNEGRDWAHNSALPDKLSSGADTAKFVNEQLANSDRHTVRSADVPDAQKNMQFLNQAIDQLYGSTLKPQETAQLKRLAREGKSGPEIDEAARYFASGHGALVQEQPAAKPFQSATVDRGMLVRQREIARDAAMKAIAERDQKTATIAAVQEHERYKSQLRTAISDAAQEGSITPKDHIRMINMLVRNDFKGIEQALSGTDQQVSRREFMKGLAATAATGIGAHPALASEFPRTSLSRDLQAKIMTGDVNGSLQEVRDHSTNPSYRMIANKLLRGGMNNVSLAVGHGRFDVAGETKLNDDGSSTVTVYPDNDGYNEETLLHEMIHAYVQQRWAGLKFYTESNKALVNDKVNRGDAVVQQFQQLWNQIGDAIIAKNPDLVTHQVWAEELSRNPDEMLSWALTNPDAQAFLRSIDAEGNKVKPGGKSLWTKVVDFVRGLLGLPPSGPTRTALDQVLSAGYSVLDAGNGVKSNDFNVKFANELRAEGEISPMRTAIATDQRLTSTVDTVSKDIGAKFRDMLDKTSDTKGSIFKALLKAAPLTHIVEKFADRDKILPEAKDIQRASDGRDAVRNTQAKVSLVASDRFTKLQREDPVNAQRVQNAMLVAGSGRNPELPWAKQTWLHKSADAGRLKQLVDVDHRDFKAMSPAARDAYFGFKNALEFDGLNHMLQVMQVVMHGDSSMQPVLDRIGDPIAAFLSMNDKHNPEGAVTYMREVMSQALGAVENHVKALRGDSTLSLTQRETLNQRVAPLEAVLSGIKSKIEATDRVPYFHLYREGDHMVAAKMATDDNGRLDPKTVLAVQKAMAAAGFDDVHIAPDVTNPKLYLALDNKAARDLAQNTLLKLQKDGHIEKDTILAGPRDARTSLLSDGSRKAMEHVLAQVAARPEFSLEGKDENEKAIVQKQLEAVQDAIRETWLNALPENSLSRVMAQRKTVQGFSKDMAMGASSRFMVGSAATARMWARPMMNDAFIRMENRARNAMAVEDPQHQHVDTIRTLVNELRSRDLAAMTSSVHDVTDTFRMISNVFHIGASVAQVLVDSSQLGVLTLPQLGAKHGYAKAFSSMARTTPIALRVLREAFSRGWDVSAARAMDASLTHDVMTSAIKDPAMRAALEKVIASGTIDIGTNVRSLISDSGLSASPKTQMVMRFSSAMAQYTEMFSRLVTALSAYDLHQRSGMTNAPEDYMMRTINDTLGQFQSSNSPPILHKSGPFNKAGPLLLQFKQFEINLMWKLYREFHTGFRDKLASPEDKATARKFLAGHLAAVTAFAGSLGLPFAAAAAGAVDKLKDELWGDEHPFDVTASYRNFLADMFGKDIADVVAKGVPRALGFDLSSRVSESDYLPFSDFLVSRRTWADTLSEWQAQAVGAPLSMVGNMLGGLDQIHNGNVLGGMSSMLPAIFRNQMRAYQMTERGYVDSNGMPLPITSPTARDVLYQLVGLTPAMKAEYNDDKEIQINAKAALMRHSNALKSQILRSLQNGDNAAARDAIAQAQKFDEVNGANPAYAVLPKIHAQLTQQYRARATAAAMGTPVGVNPRDLYARGLTQYSSVDYQPR